MLTPTQQKLGEKIMIKCKENYRKIGRERIKDKISRKNIKF